MMDINRPDAGMYVTNLQERCEKCVALVAEAHDLLVGADGMVEAEPSSIEDWREEVADWHRRVNEHWVPR